MSFEDALRQILSAYETRLRDLTEAERRVKMLQSQLDDCLDEVFTLRARVTELEVLAAKGG